ncbi:hypothetical protein [Streptomyces sp. NPDC056291]|uniref:hypothetical protein n=1 Tax=Streptomyces sp. NPDC056291 TaxID=3345772 RepID=UPI0035E275D8
MAEPFGLLDHMADVAQLESCAAFLAVMDAVLESEHPNSADALATFLRPAVEMLRDVSAIAVKHVDGTA